MEVTTARFGALSVDDERVVTVDALMGFPDAQRFTLVAVPDNEDFFWLQSLDDGSLAFLAAVPWSYFPHYAPEIGDEDERALGLHDDTDATVLCLLSIDREAGRVTANLMAPVVINTQTRRARQIVLYDQGWPVAEILGAG